MDDGSSLNPWIELNGVYSFTQEGRFTNGSYASETNGLTGQVKAGVNYTTPSGTSLTLSGQIDALGADTSSYGGTVRLTIPIQ